MAFKLSLLIVASFQIVTIHSVQFVIQNNIPGPIEVGIQGNAGHPHLHNGGFPLNPGQEITIDAPNEWAGRFWAKTWCVNGHCQTGDCGGRVECAGAGGVPPVTLVEITLRGAGNQDFYDVSLVDGFNVLASITPENGQGKCESVWCSFNLNQGCPNDLKKIGGNGNDVVGCYSSCLKYNTDQFCCRGTFNNPQTCKPENMPQPNSAGYFKHFCPRYYSYAYDDPTSTFTCLANRYRISFH
ncbi:hypothetical protein PPYR_13295 [Photinus pyralis]|uniref:Thaumatin-like protein n=1 Tax=Photinus pyralis TaxID=7054 RepID=A0A5N4A8N2_PHOPY|nr:pathogenesis-related protein 5-like [Photinus pyralis]KAB0793675.1 hypothetical protein PPYR_13295 [Photinus pyralis]